MISRLKILIFILISACSGWIGFKTYRYATHLQEPTFVIHGIKDQGVYKDTISFAIEGNSQYAIASLYATLDGTPFSLPSNGFIKKSHFKLPLSIPTTALENGPHTLRIEACDSSYNKNKSSQEIHFVVDNAPLQTALLQSSYTVDQGRTAHIKLNANKKNIQAKAFFGAHIYHFCPETPRSSLYECFLPVDCEEARGESTITIEARDEAGNINKLSGTIEVKGVEFKKATGFSIAHNKLDSEKENSLSEKILEQLLEEKTQTSPQEKLWKGAFIAPISIKKIVTPFGEIRTTREKGRYQHKAVDLIDAPRSVVWAAQDGKVIIKDRFTLSGNTIGIDHGMGIISLYYHLNDFADISIGDTIKKGNPIGTQGMTGYASGFHLHWELRVGNVAIDPFQWTETSF